MNKEEFLDELAKRLSGLPQSDIDDRVAFYREKIYEGLEKGKPEEEVIAQLGPVDEVVSKIMAEYPLSTLVRQTSGSRKVLNAFEKTMLWLSSPLWLPLGLVIFVIVIGFYLVIWSLIVSVFVSSFACAVAALGGLTGILYQLGEFSATGALFSFGGSLTSAGMAIFLFIAGIYLSKLVISLTGYGMKKIKGSLVGKEAEA